MIDIIKIETDDSTPNFFNQKIDFMINENLYKYEYNDENYNDYHSFHQRIEDKNNNIILLQDYSVFHDTYKDKYSSDQYSNFEINKTLMSKELFDVINEKFEIKSGVFRDNDYDDAYDIGVNNKFINEYKNESETDFISCKQSKNETIYMFKYDNLIFKIDFINNKANESHINIYQLSGVNLEQSKHILDITKSLSFDYDNKISMQYEKINCDFKEKMDQQIIDKINKVFNLNINKNINNIEYTRKIKIEKPKKLTFNINNIKYNIEINDDGIEISQNKKDDLIDSTIYESKKQEIVGTEINIVEYDKKLFTKEVWNQMADVLKNDFANINLYEEMIKNGVDISDQNENIQELIKNTLEDNCR